jgi:hypothetical protein
MPCSIIDIAIVAHEANRMYCQAIGDNAKVPWSQLPEHMMKSTIEGVMAVKADPSTTPERSHAAWRASKESTGWCLGDYSVEKKTHPNLVDYAELPAEQRKKDSLFLAIVKTLLAD